jgi:CRISPR system Cascade subunit CasB
MSSEQVSKQPPAFIQHLFELSDREDRGALSELKRSLVLNNEVLAMRHVLPWLGGDVGSRWVSVALLVAGLYALHPERTTGTNFGGSMGSLWQAQDKRYSTEQRFVALLSARSEDLPYYLRQAVALIASHKIPLDWAKLYRDLCNWGHTDRFVQRDWARAFWGVPTEQENQPAIEED